MQAFTLAVWGRDAAAQPAPGRVKELQEVSDKATLSRLIEKIKPLPIQSRPDESAS
jgi:hypothetical protein